MTEIKPVAWLLQCENSPEMGEWIWHEEPSGDLTKVVERLYDQQAIDTLRAEVERLRSKTACTMGVGAGDGQLFVHGDYDSIKAVQALVFRAERAEAEAEALRKDAERYRWLCDGNGYFMEENYLCGHENDKERADLMIDIEIQAGQ